MLAIFNVNRQFTIGGLQGMEYDAGPRLQDENAERRRSEVAVDSCVEQSGQSL